MGPVSRQLSWTAWKYGHPRREAIDILMKYIKKPRQPEPIKIRVGVAHEEFIEQEIPVAIYATGWDGTVILEADTNGSIRAIVHGLTMPGGAHAKPGFPRAGTTHRTPCVTSEPVGPH